MLRDTVNEVFQDLTTELAQRERHVATVRQAIDQAQRLRDHATEQETYAVCAAELAHTKQQDLLDYCQGLSTPPQAFLAKIQRLGVEHAQAVRDQQDAHALVLQRQDAVSKAEIRLAVAEAEHTALQRQLQEVMEHMQRLG